MSGGRLRRATVVVEAGGGYAFLLPAVCLGSLAVHRACDRIFPEDGPAMYFELWQCSHLPTGFCVSGPERFASLASAADFMRSVFPITDWSLIPSRDGQVSEAVKSVLLQFETFSWCQRYQRSRFLREPPGVLVDLDEWSPAGMVQ